MLKELYVNNKKVKYYESDAVSENNDKPILVLVHGWGGSWENWTAIIPLLEEHFKIIAINMPGCAGSDPLDNAHSLEHCAEFLHNYLNALQLKNVWLLGESHGGLTSLSLINTYPGLVSKLCLVSVPLGSKYIHRIGSRALGFLSKHNTAIKIGDKVRQSNLILYLWGRFFLIGSELDRKSFVEKQKEKRLLMTTKTWLEIGGYALSKDMTMHLKVANIPVLYIYGTKDGVLRQDVICSLDEHSHIKRIPFESKHLPYAHDSVTFSQEVTKFFLDQ